MDIEKTLKVEGLSDDSKDNLTKEEYNQNNVGHDNEWNPITHDEFEPEIRKRESFKTEVILTKKFDGDERPNLDEFLERIRWEQGRWHRVVQDNSRFVAFTTIGPDPLCDIRHEKYYFWLWGTGPSAKALHNYMQKEVFQNNPYGFVIRYHVLANIAPIPLACKIDGGVKSNGGSKFVHNLMSQYLDEERRIAISTDYESVRGKSLSGVNNLLVDSFNKKLKNYNPATLSEEDRRQYNDSFESVGKVSESEFKEKKYQTLPTLTFPQANSWAEFEQAQFKLNNPDKKMILVRKVLPDGRDVLVRRVFKR
jgi:hypothetical protein